MAQQEPESTNELAERGAVLFEIREVDNTPSPVFITFDSLEWFNEC